MSELQRHQLELFRSFEAVCRKLGLRYFLVCGSALGAVKYGGFIPWDDDMDVGLFREDYEVFMREAPALLPEHLFLQNYRTDPSFPAIYSKLRNSDTTCIEWGTSHLPIHHGVFIDIFPLDGYPGEKQARRKLECRKEVYRRLLSTAFRPNRWWKWIFIAPFRLMGVHRHTARIACRFEEMIARYPIADSAIIANHGNWQGKLEYAPASQYGEGVWGSFEGMPVRLPAGYDAYLRQKYHDYERDPPLSEQKGHHRRVVCDCRRSYREYI